MEPEPAGPERIAVAIEHLRLAVQLHGEDRGVREMRGQLTWYIKGMPGATRLRRLVAQAKSIDEMERALLENVEVEMMNDELENSDYRCFGNQNFPKPALP
jgi:tRNA-dihydrouridine synthase